MATEEHQSNKEGDEEKAARLRNILACYSDKKETLDKLYDMTPQRTSYRPANIVWLIQDDDGCGNDTELTRILHLAHEDRKFCGKLQDDKEFRDTFCKWAQLGHKWNASTPKEEAAEREILGAIRRRVDLVVRQKYYLGKRYPSLNDTEKHTFMCIANNELGFMPQWLDIDIPGHRHMEISIQQASKCNFSTSFVIEEE